MGALWQPRGVGLGGRELSEGGDISMTDSFWGVVKTNTIFLSSYPSIKNIFLKKKKKTYGWILQKNLG